MKILISRTDSIGDVMLTLPMIGIIKQQYPNAKIGFIGKDYTQPIINCCSQINNFYTKQQFIDNGFNNELKKYDHIIHVFPDKQIAKKAKQLKIKNRVGTTNRWYHWFLCNKSVKLSRKNSNLHEAQLNIKLLQPLNIHQQFSANELSNYYGFDKIETLDTSFKSLISSSKFNLIIHPKSQGSAREWGVDNFIDLIKKFDKNKFNIFISGTENEKKTLNKLFDEVGPEVIDITGKMSLSQFISFIDNCDGLIANSTGPLHISAALNKHTIGLFPPIRPIFPTRWKPLGNKVKVFVSENKQSCTLCKNNLHDCSCIKLINVHEVLTFLNNIANI